MFEETLTELQDVFMLIVLLVTFTISTAFLATMVADVISYVLDRLIRKPHK